jgi:hypothetical protein
MGPCGQCYKTFTAIITLLPVIIKEKYATSGVITSVKSL